MNVTLNDSSSLFNTSSPWRNTSNCCNCCFRTKKKLRLNFDKENFIIIEELTQSRFQRLFSCCTSLCKSPPYTVKLSSEYYIENWTSVEKQALGYLLIEHQSDSLSTTYEILANKILNINEKKSLQSCNKTSHFSGELLFNSSYAHEHRLIMNDRLTPTNNSSDPQHEDFKEEKQDQLDSIRTTSSQLPEYAFLMSAQHLSRQDFMYQHLPIMNDRSTPTSSTSNAQYENLV